MSRTRSLLLAAVAFTQAAGGIFAGSAVVHDFSQDPRQNLGRWPVFEVTGPGEDQFAHEADAAPRFPGDARGSLAVVYDASKPTSRLAAPLHGAFTADDDFAFGAILTIRPDLAADPFGFHALAFSLFNSATTGDDRTGDIADFRADTFDTVEMAYFPNVSPLFGGPFFSPSVFGHARGDDAFGHFTFGSAEAELVPGTTYLVVLTYLAEPRTLTARVWTVGPRGLGPEVPAARVVAGLANIEGFLVDSVGLAAYRDGFNEFAPSGRSLLATVDYDLLFAAKLVEGRLPIAVARQLPRPPAGRVMLSGEER